MPARGLAVLSLFSLLVLLLVLLVLPTFGPAARAAEPAPASPVSAPRDTASPPALMVAVGRARLEIDDADLDKKLGLAFADGVRGGANDCYIEHLMKNAAQDGEIAFVVKPPPKEGYYLVTLTAKGTLTAALVDCVRGVFHGFYHYPDQLAFDRVEGSLRFTPEMIPAPAPPPESALRAILAKKYAPAAVVKIAKLTVTGISHDVDSYSSELFRRYSLDADLEFIANGYETTCQHFSTYKVFSARPYETRAAGHSCQTQPHKVGDHALDREEIDYRLTYQPTTAKAWELRTGQWPGTTP